MSDLFDVIEFLVNVGETRSFDKTGCIIFILGAIIALIVMAWMSQYGAL